MPPNPISFSYSKHNLTNITQQSTIYVPGSDLKQGTNIFVAEVTVKRWKLLDVAWKYGKLLGIVSKHSIKIKLINFDKNITCYNW